MNKNEFSQCPALETLENGKRYAFTLSPPIDSPSKEVRKRISQSIDRIKEVLFGCSLELYPEYAYSNTQGGYRLHYHGYIIIHEVSKWMYCVRQLHNIGFVCVKALFAIDPERGGDEPPDGSTPSAPWDAYCTKQRSFIEPLLIKEGQYQMTYPVHISEPTAVDKASKIESIPDHRQDIRKFISHR